MDIFDIINGVLGALVSITGDTSILFSKLLQYFNSISILAGCYLYHAWEAILIGCIGALLACMTMPLFDKIGVDDPVGASSVHGVCGIWGVVAVGLFADNPIPLELTNGRSGLFKGGGWYLLGVQSLAAFSLAVWGILSTYFMLWLINKFVAIRMESNEELVGADLMEHNIKHAQIGVSRAVSALGPNRIDQEKINAIPVIGRNPGHEITISELMIVNATLGKWKGFTAKRVNKIKNIENQNSAKINGRQNSVFNRRKQSISPLPSAVSTAPAIATITSAYRNNNNKTQSFTWVD